MRTAAADLLTWRRAEYLVLCVIFNRKVEPTALAYAEVLVDAEAGAKKDQYVPPQESRLSDIKSRSQKVTRYGLEMVCSTRSAGGVSCQSPVLGVLQVAGI